MADEQSVIATPIPVAMRLQGSSLGRHKAGRDGYDDPCGNPDIRVRVFP